MLDKNNLERESYLIKLLKADSRKTVLIFSKSHLPDSGEKLRAKKLDMIAANDISGSDAGFGSENNRVSLLLPDGSIEELPLLAKEQVAERIVTRLAAALK